MTNSLSSVLAPIVGLIAQLVVNCTSNGRLKGSNPFKPIFRFNFLFETAHAWEVAYLT